jgi:hypothetical protein
MADNRSLFVAAVELVCESCFAQCTSLMSIMFAIESKLSRLEKRAFHGTGVGAVAFPESLDVICESCFSECKKLASVTFAVASKFSSSLNSSDW